HCVSVIKAIKFNAIAYCSPYSKALLNPNRKIIKNAILLNTSTESYFMYFNILNSNLNFLYVFILKYITYINITNKVIITIIILFENINEEIINAAKFNRLN